MKKKYKYVGHEPEIKIKHRGIYVVGPVKKGQPFEISNQDLIKQLDANSNFEIVKTKTKKKKEVKENGKI